MLNGLGFLRASGDPESYFKARLGLLAVIIPIVLICFGIGELWRCIRVAVGPRELSYAEASRQSLSGYGYVRIADIEADLSRAVAVIKRDRDDPEDPGVWTSAYVPIGPGPESESPGRYHILVWFPDAKAPQDLTELAGATEVAGFVEAPFPRINPGHQKFVRDLAGARGEDCWVMKVVHPSWLRGLGFTLGAAVIPAIFVVWRLRTPLHEA